MQPSEGLAAGTSSWWKVLLSGLMLYIFGVITLVITGNPNLFPTVVMLGSFMVPVTYVFFFYERRHMSQITLPGMVTAFVYGGLLGVFAAAWLEPFFLSLFAFFIALQVGLIEEFAKILGVLAVARHRRHDQELDGLLLGAAVGMGFAAFESSGYAFTAFLQSRGSLTETVVVMLARGILSPLGHGTWTAILASVLFREAYDGHFRLNWKVVGTYLTVVVLHAMWDGLPGVLVALMFSGLAIFVVQILVGAAGLFILRRRWVEAVKLQRREPVVTEEWGDDADGHDTPRIRGVS